MRSGWKTAWGAAGLALLAGRAWGYGEPEGGRPSLDERRIHLFTNYVRADPDAAGFGDEADPLPPLPWNGDLGEAARFYADDMSDNGCWNADHSSCDGTPFDVRVAGFYDDLPIGENIAAGYGSAESAVLDGWLYSDGHRANILSRGWTEIGTGFASGGGGPYYVEDFGGGPGAVDVRIAVAVHTPAVVSAGEDVSVWATWHDDAAPARAQVAWSDRCDDLQVVRGTASLGVWQGVRDAPGSGCHPYVVRFEAADGTEEVYPSAGALVLATGGASCGEWQEERPQAPCLASTDSGAGGCAGDEASPEEDSACSEGAANPEGNTVDESGYGTCSQASSRARGAAAGLLLLGGVLRRIRRCADARRRGPSGCTTS